MCVNISSIKRIFSNQSLYFPDIPCIKEIRLVLKDLNRTYTGIQLWLLYWVAILIVISSTDNSYRTKACRSISNAVCLHMLWIILAALRQFDCFCPSPRYVCAGIKTGLLWKPARLCFQHQIFTCSEVLWSFFAFRPGSRPTSCWMSANLCSCSAVASECDHFVGFIAGSKRNYFLISPWDLRFSQRWQ